MNGKFHPEKGVVREYYSHTIQAVACEVVLDGCLINN
jgi:hypothetical protein